MSSNRNVIRPNPSACTRSATIASCLPFRRHWRRASEVRSLKASTFFHFPLATGLAGLDLAGHSAPAGWEFLFHGRRGSRAEVTLQPSLKAVCASRVAACREGQHRSAEPVCSRRGGGHSRAGGEWSAGAASCCSRLFALNPFPCLAGISSLEHSHKRHLRIGHVVLDWKCLTWGAAIGPYESSS